MTSSSAISPISRSNFWLLLFRIDLSLSQTPFSSFSHSSYVYSCAFSIFLVDKNQNDQNVSTKFFKLSLIARSVKIKTVNVNLWHPPSQPLMFNTSSLLHYWNPNRLKTTIQHVLYFQAYLTFMKVIFFISQLSVSIPRCRIITK